VDTLFIVGAVYGLEGFEFETTLLISLSVGIFDYVGLFDMYRGDAIGCDSISSFLLPADTMKFLLIVIEDFYF